MYFRKFVQIRVYKVNKYKCSLVSEKESSTINESEIDIDRALMSSIAG
jgi:hypothetical protein